MTDHVEKSEAEEIEKEDVISEEQESEEAPPESIEKQDDDFKEKYFYLAAEVENMRKRAEREKENFIKYGNEKILSQLIEVVDNFDRTVDAIKEETDEKIAGIRDGIKMVRDQFISVLSTNGLEEVKSVGEIFDPNFHEAMAQQPAEGKEDQEIIMEYQKGYVLNGRLLRAAKVIVANNN